MRLFSDRMQASPPALSTPTAIPAGGAEEIAAALNPLIADAFALYVKTKNFHWHLAGSHFRDYHLLFDEQAGQVFDTIDTLAERVRKMGAETIKSVGMIASLTSISDDDAPLVSALDMVRRLLADNRSIVSGLRAAHEVCARYRDVATTAILEVFLDEAERRVWFLFEIAQGAERTG